MSGRSDATLKVLVWRRTDERTSVGPILIPTESMPKVEVNSLSPDSFQFWTQFIMIPKFEELPTLHRTGTSSSFCPIAAGRGRYESANFCWMPHTNVPEAEDLVSVEDW